MPRWLILAVVMTAFVLVASMVMLTVRPVTPEPAAIDPALLPDPGFEPLRIPDFALTDQEGKPVTQSLFDDRVTILDFGFTNCPLACPGMAVEMQAMAERLKGTPVRFVTITVDPANDTPDQLKKYADELAADPQRWSFLTGDAATIRRIVLQSLQFALQEDKAQPIQGRLSKQAMTNIIHPTRLVLVGPDRRILNMYEYSWPEQMQMLETRARRAAAALSKG